MKSIEKELKNKGYFISKKIIYGVEYMLVHNLKKVCGINSKYDIFDNCHKYDIYNFVYYYEDEIDEHYLDGDMICASQIIGYSNLNREELLKNIELYLNDFREFEDIKKYFIEVQQGNDIKIKKYNNILKQLGYKSTLVKWEPKGLFFESEFILASKNYITIAISIHNNEVYISNLDYLNLARTNLPTSTEKIDSFDLSKINKWFFTIEDLLNQKDIILEDMIVIENNINTK